MIFRSDWHRSPRLLYGTLLALSCDRFDTIVWATVAARSVERLAPADGGRATPAPGASGGAAAAPRRSRGRSW